MATIVISISVDSDRFRLILSVSLVGLNSSSSKKTSIDQFSFLITLDNLLMYFVDR